LSSVALAEGDCRALLCTIMRGVKPTHKREE